MSTAITNTLLMSGEAACELALMLPETDFVLELQEILLYNLTLMTEIIECKDINTIDLYNHYEKCKQIIKFANSCKKIKG